MHTYMLPPCIISHPVPYMEDLGRVEAPNDECIAVPSRGVGGSGLAIVAERLTCLGFIFCWAECFGWIEKEKGKK